MLSCLQSTRTLAPAIRPCKKLEEDQSYRNPTGHFSSPLVPIAACLGSRVHTPLSAVTAISVRSEIHSPWSRTPKTPSYSNPPQDLFQRSQLPLSTRNKVCDLSPTPISYLISPFLWSCFRKEAISILGKERLDPDTLLTLLNMGPQAEDAN